VYSITVLAFLKCKIIAIVLEVSTDFLLNNLCCILVCVLREGQCGTGCCVWVEIHSVAVRARVPSVPTVDLMYVVIYLFIFFYF
jgi:hypothetical protein